jgi:hypothetical protein
MADNNYILQIPQPCKVDWQQMTPCQTGRFCAHCSESVVDFTNLTDSQIIELIQSRNGELCGRARASQLNRVMQEVQMHSRRGYKLREIIAGLLLMITSRAAVAKHHTEKIRLTQSPVAKYNAVVVNCDSADISKPIELHGKVLDAMKHEPVEYIPVQNVNKGTSVNTDSLGKFKIFASVGDTIRIKSIGYMYQDFVVSRKNHGEMVLILDEVFDGKVVAVSPVKHRPLNRIRHFFGIKPKAHSKNNE